MSDYLKDKSIPFLTIEGSNLDAINSDFEKILKESIPSDDSLHIEYIIRYDGIGVVKKNYTEIKDCFDVAKKIERIFISLKNKESYLYKGKKIEMRLDANNYNDCYLSVSDDDEAWVEKNFKLLHSRLEKFKNKNFLVHNQFSELAIQLFGVLSGLFLSLISAKLLTPFVNIQHSFFLLFIGILLVFSNLWNYILVNVNKIRFKIWPLISFSKKPLGLLGQTIIALLITYFVGFLGKWSLNILQGAGEILTK